MKNFFKVSFLIVLLTISSSVSAADLRPNVLRPDYNNDKWQTLPKDIIREFTAFTLSFDGTDDVDNISDEDKLSDTWGIPEWVAYEIKRLETDHHLANRPSWMTDEKLYQNKIAPDNSTYAVSGTKKLKEVKGDFRFVRGHMCPKDVAERISEDAAYNTHIVLNAVPQLQWENNGIWKDLEKLSMDCADKYGQVWVICGPVFFDEKPSMWLGQDGEKKIAIPDALFKIIIREIDGPNKVDTLAFIIPNILPKEEHNLNSFLTSVERIESLTGLRFLTVLDQETQEHIKAKQPTSIEW